MLRLIRVPESNVCNVQLGIVNAGVERRLHLNICFAAVSLLPIYHAEPEY